MITPASDEWINRLPPIDVVALLGGHRWHIGLSGWPMYAVRLEMIGGPEEFVAHTMTVPIQVREAPPVLRIALIPKGGDIGSCESWTVYCDLGGKCPVTFALENGWGKKFGSFALKNLVAETASNPFAMIEYFDPERGSDHVLAALTIRLELS
jgi:hypothetical protein